ncbi:MAG TPA: type VI secretion system tip protein TssI/VgrG [Burkholderiaceae bacterium]|nr:type VI secretion system tip protein TssI/VgrG [Burkholderiaceae bacterium]
MAATDYEIKSDSPVVSELMFWRLAGHEGLSRPAAYELVVLSKNRALNAKDILGHAFDVVIGFEDADGGKHQRHFQGHAVRFTRLAQAGRYFEYRIELRSWFWLLTKRANARILQDKPVLEVLDAVIEDSPIKRLKKLKTDQVAGRHEPHRYCVQFEESDYDFLSRLLEEEGIYYWFDAHDAPGTMHLSDNSAVAHEALPAVSALRYVSQSASQAPRQAEITRWVSARRFDTGKHAAVDSNFKAIRKKIGATIEASDDHELADLEVFEFPGDYFSPDDAEAAAKVRGDELSARRDRHWAFTAWPDVAAGRSFKFEGDPDGVNDGEYIVSGCTMVVVHPGYEGMGDGDPAAPVVPLLQRLLAEDAVNAVSLDMAMELVAAHPDLARPGRGACAFLLTLHPVAMPFRPPRLTPRKPMPGPQSAIVVGPQGDELHVDEFGRIKVHFHWDRYDQSNEKSTCWVRVSQPWAGKGWGGYFMPRIGQEVIVDFLNGDPDRPIVIGRMYNDDQPIPYKSPTQSGFKTRSTPGGDSTTGNEIMFEDKKGAEKINIHAELDMSRSVERDDSTSVDRDQSVTVKRDQKNHVDRDRSSTVTRNDTNMVVVDQSNTVKGKQNNQVVGNRDSYIDSNDLLKVKGTSTVDVTGARSTTFRAGEKHTVVGNQTIAVTGNLSYKATNMTFEAAHVDWNVTGANSQNITVPAGPLRLAANKIKIMSNTGLEMMAVGDIDAISVGSNTTVLGPNSSGYIGNNSEANLGMNRSTFIGLNMEAALALSMSNFAGAQLDNTAGFKMETVAAACIEQKTTNMRQSTLTCFGPGAGAPAGVGGAAVAAQLGAVVGIVSGAVDMAATADQYAKAAGQLEKAAKDAAEMIPPVPGLEGRLRALAGATRERMRDAGAGLLTLGVGIVMQAGLDAVGGPGGGKTAGDLSDAGPGKDE